MEWLLGLLGGAIGGGIGGAKNPLGPLGNGAAGAVGGGITGAIIQAVTSSGLDFSQILGQVGIGGVVGAAISAILNVTTKSKAATR
ncbi:hypothetical protein [Rhodococcus sp. NPDC003348]